MVQREAKEASDRLGRRKAEGGSRHNTNGRLVKWEDAWLATRKSGFDSPAGPLTQHGLMVQRQDTAMAWQPLYSHGGIDPW